MTGLRRSDVAFFVAFAVLLCLAWLVMNDVDANARADDVQRTLTQVTTAPTPTVTRTVTVVRTPPPAPPRTIYVTRASRSNVRKTPKPLHSSRRMKVGTSLDLAHKDFWMCVHGREGRWADNSGYEGGLQFAHSTWISAGGRAFAEHAYQATPDEQITVANWLSNDAHTGLNHGWPNTAPPCRGLL